jgi:hypothetical protein
LIFEKIIVEGDLYKYPIKNILKTAKFLPTWDLINGIAQGFYRLQPRLFMDSPPYLKKKKQKNHKELRFCN